MPVGALPSNGKAIPGTAMAKLSNAVERHITEQSWRSVDWHSHDMQRNSIARHRDGKARQTPARASQFSARTSNGRAGEAFTSNGTAKKTQLRQPKEQQWNSNAKKPASAGLIAARAERTPARNAQQTANHY